uniref:Uncharacterized protein n=1 Tax=Macrostomum lignano TaxID=282301 RepID=A0A1I8FLE9_9PLAT
MERNYTTPIGFAFYVQRSLGLRVTASKDISRTNDSGQPQCTLREMVQGLSASATRDLLVTAWSGHACYLAGESTSQPMKAMKKAYVDCSPSPSVGVKSNPDVCL